MNARRVLQAFRAAFALLATAAWLLASNHCVVAGLLPAPSTTQGAHEHCPGHKSPEQPKKNGGCDGQNCCKSLSALAPISAKILAAVNSIAIPREDYPAVETNVFGEGGGVLLCELDTGPPSAVSFAEAVLQQSLLAHAPPVRA